MIDMSEFAHGIMEHKYSHDLDDGLVHLQGSGSQG